VGLLRKVARKSVRKVTPRPVRQVNRVVRHPVSASMRAVTPRPIRQAERSVFNVTHPINAVENKAVNAMIGPPIRYAPRKTRSPGPTARSQAIRPQPVPPAQKPPRLASFLSITRRCTTRSARLLTAQTLRDERSSERRLTTKTR
jgi:hypothetical protein